MDMKTCVCPWVREENLKYVGKNQSDRDSDINNAIDK